MNIKTVTVVGANGTMGRNISAIFAAFGNARVYMVSRSLEKSEKAKEKACQSVRAESIKKNMIPVDYSALEKCVTLSDIVFESSAEKWNIKADLTKRIAEIAETNKNSCENTVFCTGTSGLSITKLSGFFSGELRKHYIGMHFFNPPYTMTLCELTPTEYTDKSFFESVKSYCSNVLLRTVVEVKDSPAFLGNRIGFQFINEALQYADKYKYSGGIDYIDAILGCFTGRTMAPLVTSDFVGLDVHKAIVDNIYQNTNDFAHETFVMPEFAENLIAEGHLGRKTGSGFYQTVIHDSGVKIRQVYDIETGAYRNVMKYQFPFVEFIIKALYSGDYEQAFKILMNNHSNEAKICCGFMLKYVIYSLKTAELVGIHSADDVMAAGFNWCPPLAIIDAFGGLEAFKELCNKRIDYAILEQIDFEQLFRYVTPSKYDYRKFIKSKR